VLSSLRELSKDFTSMLSSWASGTLAPDGGGVAGSAAGGAAAAGADVGAAGSAAGAGSDAGDAGAGDAIHNHVTAPSTFTCTLPFSVGEGGPRSRRLHRTIAGWP
jgi:hypothetical protein